MKITKFGHSCFGVQTGQGSIVTDPGSYAVVPETLENVHAVLISHEHPDHLDVDLVRKMRTNSPNVRIFTNEAVGAVLTHESISFELLEAGSTVECAGVKIRAFGRVHKMIHPEIAQVPNTGFLIDERLWYPGDSLLGPGRDVEAIALPIAGSWLRLAEAIDFAIELKPKVVFTVHDGMLRPERTESFYMVARTLLTQAGIRFEGVEEGQTIEI